MTTYHRPDVITLRGPLVRQRRGVYGLPAFDAPTVMEDDTGLVLSYSRTPEGVLRGGFSRSHATYPWAWTLGMIALGWAGGYFTWLAIGRRR